MSFEQTYRCYPASFIDKPHIENGDKIIMPPSALDRLASLQIDYPMLFELQNVSAERVSHCGVLEFIAEEGMIYMPYWMMETLLLQEGDIVRLKNATLPKGKYVKLQPHTKDFLDISNPKAILETTLRNFSCLTTGDSIMVAYNNKKYYIDIVETKPSNAISIIETDCEVDFAPTLDYIEPEKPVSSLTTGKAQVAGKDALLSLSQNLTHLLELVNAWMGNLSATNPGRFLHPHQKIRDLKFLMVVVRLLLFLVHMLQVVNLRGSLFSALMRTANRKLQRSLQETKSPRSRRGSKISAFYWKEVFTQGLNVYQSKGRIFMNLTVHSCCTCLPWGEM